MFSTFLKSRISAHIAVTWQDKCHGSKCPPSSSFALLSFFCWGQHCMVWAIALVIWGQLSWLHFPPAFCAPSASRHQNFHIFPISTPRLLASSVTYKFQQCSATHWCVISTGWEQVQSVAPYRFQWIKWKIFAN